MTSPEVSIKTFTGYRIIFYACAIYFFCMSLFMILAPGLILQPAGKVTPLISGMIRGAGGSILPYTLIYIILARQPAGNKILAMIVAVANILAIALDLFSVFAGEYKFVYALLDLPIEVLSLSAVTIIYLNKTNHR